ncbi:MAG: prolyl-tRNA synthetase associated domain-containing protein [Candidatus Moranbacteria bacterium]|nr:prolyl-tRNA synthetase associated domain-containing protein [Candidatus Moranbacteria bacterium]
MEQINKVLRFLDDNKIEYKLHEHPAVYTCEQAKKYCTGIPGIAGKNLFLTDKKKGRFFLVVMPANKRMDLKGFAKKVKAIKLSFGSSQELEKLLELTPGSVSPLGLLNDQKQMVELFIDSDVLASDMVNFHPNDNKASVELTQAMFRRFLEKLGRKYQELG